MIFGGEALKPRRLRTWLENHPGPRLINMYGLTEATVHASAREILAGDVVDAESPIGIPLAHLGLFVLDPWLCRVAAVWWVSCMWLVRGWVLVMWVVGV